MPNLQSEGGIVRQALRANGRPLPIVYVKMDSHKIREDLFPERIIPFSTQKKRLFSKDRKIYYRLVIQFQSSILRLCYFVCTFTWVSWIKQTAS
jgi:hypothetical protein